AWPARTWSRSRSGRCSAEFSSPVADVTGCARGSRVAEARARQPGTRSGGRRPRSRGATSLPTSSPSPTAAAPVPRPRRASRWSSSSTPSSPTPSAMRAKTASYPGGREADVALRDGSTVHVRPVRAEDEAELREFLESLSPDSRVLRFFSGGTNLRQAAQAAADVDYRRRYGLVATAGADAAIVAHAEYIATGGDEAEIAFEVSDAAQGMGLGTLLLAHLAQAAGENGITTFVAHVMPANHRMIEVFRKSGFATSVRSLAGILLVEFPTSVSPEAVAAFEHRDQVAAAAAVGRILAPSSVAVVGASRREGSIGGEILGNLVDAGFSGRLYPVN